MAAPAWMTEKAHRTLRNGRIVLLECPHCGHQWDVLGRGRETGFIVSAANNHSSTCARLLAEGATKADIMHRRFDPAQDA